ncbi:hypothetical protein F4808DRAFT_473212 [Astrocystis sublimbata]|nr:hypothetical protein F4808DRAFT_473212 [Astrocystis sublimbata]
MDGGKGPTKLTNLGPLPTGFVLDNACAESLDSVYKYFTSSTGFYYLLQGPVEQTSCYPSGYSGNTAEYYSPARCPTGYTSACSSVNVAGTVEETVVRCCPTHADFVCQTEPQYGWESTLGCLTAVDPATTRVWSVGEVESGKTSDTVSTGLAGGINAYQIQVGFQSTDIMANALKPQPTSTSQSTSTINASPSRLSSNENTTAEHENGLSGGAIAGIVIGVLAGLLAVAVLLWLKIRSGRRQPQVAELDDSHGKPVVAAADGDVAQGYYAKDKEGMNAVELDGQSYTNELSAIRFSRQLKAVEMDADSNQLREKD